MTFESAGLKSGGCFVNSSMINCRHKKMFTPGFQFKDGKLCLFQEQRVLVLTSWPDLRAITKTPTSRWSPFWPEFRVIHPYRPEMKSSAKPEAQLQLSMNLEATQTRNVVAERKRAFDSYRFSFPRDIAGLVEKFQTGQWEMFHLLKSDAKLLELLAVNPALAWFQAQKTVSRLRNHEKIPLLSGVKQRTLAARLGFPEADWVVNLFKKVPAESASRDRLSRFRAAIENKNVQKQLSHLPCINAGVLEIAGDPVLFESSSASLLAEVGTAPREKYRADTVNLMEQVLAMHEVLCPGIKPKFQSLEQLQRVHDEMAVEYSRRAPAGVLAAKFPRPPVPAVSNCIVPIRTPKELVEEGGAQENCVATYAKRIESGNVYIYRVLHPERATLSLVRNEQREWEIGELKAARNAPVSAATEKLVRDWLNRFELTH
jgi:PcfJ-like protein